MLTAQDVRDIADLMFMLNETIQRYRDGVMTYEDRTREKEGLIEQFLQMHPNIRLR